MDYVVIAMSRGVLEYNQIDNSTQRNCLAAVKTIDEKKAKYAVTCGGIFQPKSIQSKPIAVLMSNTIEKMYLYLEMLEDEECGKQHNRPEQVIVEKESLDTYQNVEFMNTKFEELEIEKDINIIICSDYFHYVRTKILLKYYGYKNIFHSSFSKKDVDCKISLPIKEIMKELILICMAIYDPTGKKYWPVRQIIQKERGRRSRGEAYLSY